MVKEVAKSTSNDSSLLVVDEAEILKPILLKCMRKHENDAMTSCLEEI